MSRLAVAAADVILGACCPGCERPAMALCRACGSSIRPDPFVAWPAPVPSSLQCPDVVPVAAGANAGALRAAIIAWKEQGRFGLGPVLAHLLAASVTQLSPADGTVVLVPVPASRRSRRARGTDVVDELARGSARLLRRVGINASVDQTLAYARRTRDQSELGAAERAANLSGAFRARSGHPTSAGTVIVVDDILTTGATVGEAVRVLTSVGRRPAGIAVVAATPRARSGKR